MSFSLLPPLECLVRLGSLITSPLACQALGITSQHVSAIEQDKRAPSLASLVKIAEELGVSVDYLLTGQEGVITDTIPAIKADKKLKLEVKKTLITLLRALYGGED